MKNILVVCDQSNIDIPLRRSLAHLHSSCEITITPNGYQAFEELTQKTFDLTIIDSEITGIDSLELMESVAHSTPDVPVIIMLNQGYKAMWGPARRLKANPILRPFKPVTFLRLIDTLLHEHRDHYHQLAETLTSILEKLCIPIQAPITFLVDDAGQPLISAGETENNLLAELGDLAIRTKMVEWLPNDEEYQDIALLAQSDTDKDHELYLTNVTKDLHLALVFPTATSHLTSIDVWQWIDATAKEVRTAFLEAASENSASMLNEYKNGATNQNRTVIPLKIDLAFISEESAGSQEMVSVNWDINFGSSHVLDRLQSFC